MSQFFTSGGGGGSTNQSSPSRMIFSPASTATQQSDRTNAVTTVTVTPKIPAGVFSKMLVMVYGPGGYEGYAGATFRNASGGGGGGFAAAIMDVPSNGILQTITVGGPGVTSSYGSLLSATSGANGTFSDNNVACLGGAGGVGSVSGTYDWSATASGGRGGNIAVNSGYYKATGGGAMGTILGNGGNGGDLSSAANDSFSIATGGGGIGGNNGVASAFSGFDHRTAGGPAFAGYETAANARNIRGNSGITSGSTIANVRQSLDAEELATGFLINPNAYRGFSSYFSIDSNNQFGSFFNGLIFGSGVSSLGTPAGGAQLQLGRAMPVFTFGAGAGGGTFPNSGSGTPYYPGAGVMPAFGGGYGGTAWGTNTTPNAVNLNHLLTTSSSWIAMGGGIGGATIQTGLFAKMPPIGTVIIFLI
jgi:hypothetical protein